MSVCHACEEESSGYLGMRNADYGRKRQDIFPSYFLFLDLWEEQHVPVSSGGRLGSRGPVLHSGCIF